MGDISPAEIQRAHWSVMCHVTSDVTMSSQWRGELGWLSPLALSGYPTVVNWTWSTSDVRWLSPLECSHSFDDDWIDRMKVWGRSASVCHSMWFLQIGFWNEKLNNCKNVRTLVVMVGAGGSADGDGEREQWCDHRWWIGQQQQQQW